MTGKRKQYSREDRAQRRETMGWNATKTFYHSFAFPLWIVGKHVIVRGSGRSGVIKAISKQDTGSSSGRTLPLRWTSMEQVQYEDGSIEEGIYESQIIGA